MSGFTIVILAAIVGLILGSALVPGAPVFGLPIVAILVGILGFTELRRRQHDQRSMEEFRDRADTDPVEFTARDRETLAE